jgi:hypothetical protein
MSCRRTKQMESTGGNEKEAVKGYFNGVGFERWNRIYSETDDVNSVCFPFCLRVCRALFLMPLSRLLFKTIFGEGLASDQCRYRALALSLYFDHCNGF